MSDRVLPCSEIVEGWRRQRKGITHNLFQALPDPPLALVERWEGYLTKSRNQCSRFGSDTDDELESKWLEYTGHFSKPFEEEEVIQSWERAVENMK
jgi:hypothetical protein